MLGQSQSETVTPMLENAKICSTWQHSMRRVPLRDGMVDSKADRQLGLRVTPRGRLLTEPAADATELDARVAARLTRASTRGSGDLLLQLGAGEVGQPLPAAFTWWRSFAGRYVAALCLHASGEKGSGRALPDFAATARTKS